MNEVMCPDCKHPTTFRDRTVIADALHAATIHCATENTDWSERFNHLLARLAWIEGELRSICNECIRAQFAQLPPTPEEIQRRYVERTPNVSSPFLQPRLRVVHND